MPPHEKHWQLLERDTQRTLAALRSWPEEKLRHKPRPECWSALEVLDHLARVEHEFARAVERCPRPGPPIGLRDRLSGWVVIRVMRSPMKVRVPTGVRDVLPRMPTSLAEIENEWKIARVGLRNALAHVSESDRRGVVQHPVGGWMTCKRTIKFVSAHLHHHIFQLRKLGVN